MPKNQLNNNELLAKHKSGSIIGMHYTPEVKSRIKKKCVTFARHGLTRVDACDMVGIGYDTLLAWFAEDPEFKDEVRKAEKALKLELLKRMKVWSTKNGAWCAWMLERKWSDEYALTTKQKIEGYLESSQTDAERAARRDRVKKFLGELMPRGFTAVESRKNRVSQNVTNMILPMKGMDRLALESGGQGSGSPLYKEESPGSSGEGGSKDDGARPGGSG